MNKEEKAVTWPYSDTELLLSLPSDAWYRNGQNSQPAAWPHPQQDSRQGKQE